MSDRESPIRALAELLRSEDTPISSYVVDPSEVDAAALPPAYDLLFEQVREGYLLHYEDARVLAGQDEDLALLAGDYLYALGLARLAALADDSSVVVLADLISSCAQLHAEDRRGEVPALWREAAAAITPRS
ncbi:MAG TPA: hypothetical protein VGO66_08920 [Solirubrobacterales bacterium]|jgi:hypothetical protein|nr:hypothetical protein [Solirubrobacterales bacterium]